MRISGSSGESPAASDRGKAAPAAGAHNPDIAQAFDDIADLLELQKANAFRVRAYRNAARVVRSLGADVSTMLAHGDDLSELPGIGADLAAKIKMLAETGHLPMLEKLRRGVPAVAADLLKLPGLGPRRVKVLCDKLKLRNLEQLHRAVVDGRVRELEGFGATTERKLLEALETHPETPKRLKLALAESYVEPLLTWLRDAPGVDRAVAAGSYRRRQETVGDIDILVAAPHGKPVVDRFVSYAQVASVIAAGETRATIALRSGLQVDLRVVPARSYGAALHYLTGSKAHNIAIRRIAQDRGLKINEYGVFHGRRRIAGATEEEVYRAVELPYIEPELREDRGEIEAAEERRLPGLLDLPDIRGDLHVHSDATDGHDTLPALAEAARQRGLEYVAITDHSRRLAMAHGLDSKRLMAQIDAVDRLNARHLGVTLLKGIEVDILEDGQLDLPDSVLSRVDLVVGAVHSQFALSRDRQTARILRAMERPHFTILAHPTGRLIGEREPYDIDMARIIRAAKERGCFIELNAQPERLDITDLHCRIAKEEGVLVSVATDAHRVAELANLRFGVGQARRGWLEKDDVLNTRSLASLRPLLARTMR